MLFLITAPKHTVSAYQLYLIYVLGVGQIHPSSMGGQVTQVWAVRAHPLAKVTGTQMATVRPVGLSLVHWTA